MNHFLSDRRWLWTVFALMVMRLTMSWLLLNDIPKLPSHDGWYFRHGGDQDIYFHLAQSIVAGHPQPATVGIGQPLVIALLLRLTQAPDYLGVLPWLVILHGFVYGGLSVWAMAVISRAFTGSRWQSFVTAGLWTFSGYALWLGLGLHWDAENLRDAYLTRQLWMEGMTDAPSLFLMLSGIMLMALAESERRASAAARDLDKWFLLSGLAFGLAVTVRIHTLMVGGVVFFALLWSRQWRNLLALGIGFGIGLTPQIIYTFAAEGGAFSLSGGFNIPYIGRWFVADTRGNLAFNWHGMPFSPKFLLDSLILLTRGSWFLALAGIAAVCLAAYAFLICWRQCGSTVAIVLFGAPLSSLVLHITTFVFVTDPIRFSLPALSIGIPATVWTMFVVIEALSRLANRGKQGKERNPIPLFPQSKKGNY